MLRTIVGVLKGHTELIWFQRKKGFLLSYQSNFNQREPKRTTAAIQSISLRSSCLILSIDPLKFLLPYSQQKIDFVCLSPSFEVFFFSASIFTPTGNRPKCFSSSTFLPPRQVNEKTAKIALTETMPGTCHRLRIPSLVSSRSPRGSNDSEPMTPKKERHRVAMMGAARVGKSSIISQFLYEKYLSRYKQTVEDMHRGEYELPDGSCLTLDILDTSGSYQFPAMRALSINTSGAFILVYAVDDEETWLEVERLRGQVIFEIREIGWG